MSSVIRKPDFCLCESKDADQLCSNCTADQRLCFRYSDSTIPPLPLPKISRLYLSSETVQAALCETWSETPKTGFRESQNWILLWYDQAFAEKIKRYKLIRKSLKKWKDNIQYIKKTDIFTFSPWTGNCFLSTGY